MPSMSCSQITRPVSGSSATALLAEVVRYITSLITRGVTCEMRPRRARAAALAAAAAAPDAVLSGVAGWAGGTEVKVHTRRREATFSGVICASGE